jgi:Gp37 protein
VANILELEEAIIVRLKSKVSEANISELPLDPSQIGEPTTATQIWVAFREEQFDPVVSVMTNPRKPPTQGRKITYELIIRGQELRTKGHQRIYPILDKIRDALAGWMPEAIHRNRDVTRPFYPVRSGFTNMGAGLWVYSMTFTIDSSYSAPLQH